MIKQIIIILLIIIEIFGYIYHYSIILNQKILTDIPKLLNLNEIIENKEFFFNHRLKKYKYNKNTICYKYNTYSKYLEYKYINTYLIKDNKTFLLKYNFFLEDNTEYKYLLLLKININNSLDIFIKYNNTTIIDNIILKMILGNLYK
jgi:hypothetical protein